MATVSTVYVPAPAKRQLKIVPQFDQYSRVVEFGQTAFGKLVLIAGFAVCLIGNRFERWMEMTLAIALLSFLPAQRRLLVSFITFYWLLFHNDWLKWDLLRSVAHAEGYSTAWQLDVIIALEFAAVFGAVAIWSQYLQSQRTSFIARRPVLCLIAGASAALIAASALPTSGLTRLIAWTFVGVLTPLLWYFAYALKDTSSPACDSAMLQYGTVRPFWGPNTCPHAKGAAYLRKTEARTPHDLCIVQLKAIKLLIWIFFLRILWRLFEIIGYGDWANAGSLFSVFHMLHLNQISFGIPRLGDALRIETLPISRAWASLALSFPDALLNMTVTGNLIVACCRMAGFNILRNTYRPLEARTISEFWNRFYYYFKELLVEFFFFPTFTRYFKRYRRLRMFVATFTAAALGNMIYHFLQGYYYVPQMGLGNAFTGFLPYAFYATLLGIGIGISVIRNQGKDRLPNHAPWWRKALATSGVIVFFTFLGIFDLEGRSIQLNQCFHFLFRLFSISI